MRFSINSLAAALLAAAFLVAAPAAGDGARAFHDGGGWRGGQGDGWRVGAPGRSVQFRKRDRRDSKIKKSQRRRGKRGGKRRRQGRADHDRARDAVRGGQALPLADIISGLRNRCPGTFLNASLVRTDRGLAYRVRLLRPSGRRITLMIDAGTGALVGGRCG